MAKYASFRIPSHVKEQSWMTENYIKVGQGEYVSKENEYIDEQDLVRLITEGIEYEVRKVLEQARWDEAIWNESEWGQPEDFPDYRNNGN